MPHCGVAEMGEQAGCRTGSLPPSQQSSISSTDRESWWQLIYKT